MWEAETMNQTNVIQVQPGLQSRLESRASFEVRRKEAQIRRRRKKKTERTLVAASFTDLYRLTGEVLATAGTAGT